MHLAVQLVKARHIAIVQQRPLHRDIAAQLHQLFVGYDFRNQLNGLQLYRLAQKRTLADLCHRKPRHIGARLRDNIDQAFGSQPCHRIRNRAARYAQLFTDFRLAQNLAGSIGQRQNGMAKGLINALTQGTGESFQRQQLVFGQDQVL